MATARLVPGAYTLSSTTYLTISDADNMYTNTDSTTYAQITHNRASTTAYYLYIHNFNFSSVPDDAEVTSFTIKIRGLESGLSTNSSYRMSLYNNTTAISNTTASASLSTTNTTFTFPNGSLTWSTLKGYGNNFRIRVPLRRNSSNTSGYVRIYGAEILVEYADKRTITTTLSGNGTISPSGATIVNNGDEFELTITPTNKSDTVTVKNNNVDVTADLETHYTGGTATSMSTASGSGVTTGFSRSGGAFYQSSSTSSDAWLRYAIGKTAESPYSTTNTSNTYVKDGTNDVDTKGWMNYPFDFSGLPLDAEVTSIEVKCYGAIENASQTASHSEIELYCGDELKSVTQSFTSTSNGTITINNPGTWDRHDLQDAWVRFIVGYYGGRLLGITWKVNYTTGGSISHYTYEYVVSGDATIAVVIESSGETSKLYIKSNGSWVEVTSAYKKVNGSWVLQPDLTSVFSSGTNYRKGN